MSYAVAECRHHKARAVCFIPKCCAADLVHCDDVDVDSVLDMAADIATFGEFCRETLERGFRIHLWPGDSIAVQRCEDCDCDRKGGGN